MVLPIGSIGLSIGLLGSSMVYSLWFFLDSMVDLQEIVYLQPRVWTLLFAQV